MRKLRLHSKFIIFFTGMAIVPLAIVAFGAVAQLQQTLATDASKLGHQLAESAAAEIRSFMVSQLKMLDNIAVLYNPNFPIEPQVAERVVENLLFASENFMDISVAGSDGGEIVRKDRLLVVRPDDLRDISSTPQFAAVKERGIYVGPVYVVNGRPFFDFGRRILDSDSTFAGAVFARVDARVMTSVVERISRLSGGRVYVVDDRGIVIAHPDLSYVLAERDLSALPPVRQVAEGLQESSAEVYDNERGERVLGSAHAMTIELFDTRSPEPAGVDWFVIAEQPEEDVFRDARRAAAYSTVISLFAAALAAAAAFYVARKISRPIETLHAAATRFGEGDLSYRADVETGDEIEDLAHSFNTMAEALGRNIESLKNEQRIVSAERDKLQMILSGITNAVVAVDLEGKIVLFNKAAAALTSRGASDVIGESIGDVMAIYDGERKIPVEEYCPSNGSDEGTLFAKNNTRMVDDAGREHFVNVASGRIREGARINVGCILTFQDVTREFLLERTKREFVSIAAHQLRTPLTNIKWSVGYLLSGMKGELAEAQRELVAQSLDAVDRMIALVNDLLDVSRIEEGRFGVNPRRQSISPILRRVAELARKSAPKRGIAFTFDAEDNLPLLDIDADKVEIVLNNILDNAMQYTPSGGSVSVRVRAADSHVMISVSDTGIGIPLRDRERIFTKFFRAPDAQARHTDGSGLGLYVAKNIVDQHGGAITFESEEGGGTTFFVSLPIPRRS